MRIENRSQQAIEIQDDGRTVVRLGRQGARAAFRARGGSESDPGCPAADAVDVSKDIAARLKPDGKLRPDLVALVDSRRIAVA